MAIINPLAYTIANGDPVDATPVQANLNQIVSDVNANAATVAGSAAQEFLVATTTNPAGAVPLAQAQAQFGAYTVPTGAILDFAGTVAPTGFLSCDGSAVSRTTYSALFSAIGTTWGAGDGSTTFNLPNLQRKTTIGAGGTSVSGPGTAVGNTGGEETHTLTTPEMPSHTHTDAGHGHGVSDPGHNHSIPIQNDANPSSLGSQTGAPVFNGTTYTGTAFTGISLGTGYANLQNTGGDGAHNNMQPSAVVLKIIKT